MTQAYVYQQTEPQLWTTGHYDPKGTWYPDQDHDSEGKAAMRTRYLNGGDITTKYERSPLDIIAEQLTRIADALERPARPDMREMTRNSLPDAPHRNEVTDNWRERLQDARYAMVGGNPDSEPVTPEMIEAWLDHIEGETRYLAPIDAALSEVSAVELHDCTQRETVTDCPDCPDRTTCAHMD